MALDRTWYNTLVDDDGSNTVGTVWGKDDVDALMDAVDASLAAPMNWGPAHVVPQFTVGQVDNVSGGTGSTLWLMNASVSMFLTGILAPAADGATHVLVNTGASLITLAHLYGSAAANQFIGAGYANTDLLSWRALTVVYVAGYQKWVIVKP